MKPYARAERVGGLLQAALSDILRKSTKDPRLDGATITGVKMTADLKLARIYFVISESHGTLREDALAGFAKAHGFIKYALAQELDLRYMPKLEFFYDESIEYGIHMANVLKRLKSDNARDHQTTEEE